MHITSLNADRLRCRILCEAGGVTASYFEWVQDRGVGYFWSEAEVNERFDSIMRDSVKDVVAYATSHSLDIRSAAYAIGIDRVACTVKQCGIYA